MNYCVYWIREQSHTDMMSQGYIGVSSNADKRFTAHKEMNRGTNAHLRHAIKKYGWDNLIKSVLIYAEKDYCLDIERKLRPANKIGWNLTVGGGLPPIMTGPQPKLKGRLVWNKGKTGVYSEESKHKMSLARKGKPAPNKGIPHTEETKAKLSMLFQGQKSPMDGKKHSPEAIEKIRLSKVGKLASEETRKKMSLIHSTRIRPPLNEQHKIRLSMLAKGKRWYNNGKNSVFCYEGQQPEGYVLGRGNRKFVKEN